MRTVYESPRYDVQSFGNGIGCVISRHYDGGEVWLQGDEAAEFLDTLDRTPAAFQDAACSDYDDVMDLEPCRLRESPV